MIKTFPINFVQAALEQTLLMAHISNPDFFGGKKQISLSSFYQQLKNQDEVDRFVEQFQDLVQQQNRLDLIGNGILLSPENPTITNLYSCLIIPMTYNCAIRCQLSNRDQMLETINNLIEELKGAKCDIAQLKCKDSNGKTYYQPFMVGTIGHNDGAPKIKNGDYVGSLESATDLENVIGNLLDQGLGIEQNAYWFYCQNNNKLKVVAEIQDGIENIVESIGEYSITDGRYITIDVYADNLRELNNIDSILGNFFINGDETVYLENIVGTMDSYEWVGGQTKITLTFDLGRPVSEIVTNFDSIDIDEIQVNLPTYTPQFLEDDGTHKDIIFPPEHENFEKFKLSMSFESLRCDTPYTLDSEEYCEISFGGSATLVNDSVKLGNDLVKVCVNKKKIITETPIVFETTTYYYLEPLEMPSGNNANTKVNQLISNKFLNNSHTDALSITLQYTFVVDESIWLLKQWFNYGRYGTQYVGNANENVQTMSPNLIYDIKEYWSSWGNVDIIPFIAKIVGSVDIENTEGDTLTLGVTMQVQGENN